jgi:hypothetical protein
MGVCARASGRVVGGRVVLPRGVGVRLRHGRMERSSAGRGGAGLAIAVLFVALTVANSRGAWEERFAC